MRWQQLARIVLAAAVVLAGIIGRRAAAAPVDFPGPSPGAAHLSRSGSVWTLHNTVIEASWDTSAGTLRPVVIANLLTGQRFAQTGREAFRLATGTAAAELTVAGSAKTAVPLDYNLAASAFSLAAPPRSVRLAAERAGVRLADRVGGTALDVDLVSTSGLRAHWHAELRDGSSYIRQTLSLQAPQASVALSGVEMTDIDAPDLQTIGSCPGCPVAGDGLYFGAEMPGAHNDVSASGARIGFGCQLQITANPSYVFGSVYGVATPGQLRRSFLFYIERERARPSKPFLHYNDWYDLAFNVDQKTLLDTVAQFDQELVKKRGVPVLSYLVDDGWDDPGKSLWQENRAKFPDGFQGLGAKLGLLGTHMSLWISPLGGYSYADQRTAHAREMGLISAASGLDLAQPGYKTWFQERCLQLMREDGVNAFKWDRAGDGVSPHFMALLDIAKALRKQNPDVLLNVTVGTWPSPFWLNYIDSTWRNGSADVGWAGAGDDREKWLTYRDGWCHRLFVEKSPLYPLNSVMHHGIVHGRQYQGERVGKTGPNLKNEARSYFANGTMLQELYITPSMMTPAAWDDVADAARWAHANADVLVDSHWVGGDPLKAEPYGYAAWNRRKGTLMLRNPSDAPQTIALDAAMVFDLPAGAPTRYRLGTPYSDQRIQTLDMSAGRAVSVTLQPFEVLVFDAWPVR